jgi:hypothetical protein
VRAQQKSRNCKVARCQIQTIWKKEINKLESLYNFPWDLDYFYLVIFLALGCSYGKSRVIICDALNYLAFTQ